MKITEEINELKEKFTREIKKTCLELKSYYDNKEESVTLEIRIYKHKLNTLKKIDLKSKAKKTELPESKKTQRKIEKFK